MLSPKVARAKPMLRRVCPPIAFIALNTCSTRAQERQYACCGIFGSVTLWLTSLAFAAKSQLTILITFICSDIMMSVTGIQHLFKGVGIVLFSGTHNRLTDEFVRPICTKY